MTSRRDKCSAGGGQGQSRPSATPARGPFEPQCTPTGQAQCRPRCRARRVAADHYRRLNHARIFNQRVRIPSRPCAAAGRAAIVAATPQACQFRNGNTCPSKRRGSRIDESSEPSRGANYACALSVGDCGLDFRWAGATGPRK